MTDVDVLLAEVQGAFRSQMCAAAAAGDRGERRIAFRLMAVVEALRGAATPTDRRWYRAYAAGALVVAAEGLEEEATYAVGGGALPRSTVEGAAGGFRVAHRVRAAVTAAVAALVQGRPLTPVESWELTAAVAALSTWALIPIDDGLGEDDDDDHDYGDAA